ncbi:predicted GPI-anchored protein 58 [Perognathus longimembris pacificus]|uniref:predicted GPI-anchored protein 58 n=1 Tax=Perognathus longimembris pacificus TaxID=214514 RepID=UPI0020191C53|nr:predicted GPI-anchored protein 58 [Perognathus longimembris pacificus]
MARARRRGWLGDAHRSACVPGSLFLRSGAPGVPCAGCRVGLVALASREQLRVGCQPPTPAAPAARAPERPSRPAGGTSPFLPSWVGQPRLRDSPRRRPAETGATRGRAEPGQTPRSVAGAAAPETPATGGARRRKRGRIAPARGRATGTLGVGEPEVSKRGPRARLAPSGSEDLRSHPSNCPPGLTRPPPPFTLTLPNFSEKGSPPSVRLWAHRIRT